METSCILLGPVVLFHLEFMEFAPPPKSVLRIDTNDILAMKN